MLIISLSLSMDQRSYEILALENLQAGVALIDSEFKLIWANSKFKALYAKYPAAFKQLRDRQLSPAILANGLLNPKAVDEELELGSQRWQISAKAIQTDQPPQDGQQKTVILLEIRPIQALSTANKGKDQLPQHSDPLTGVLSRSSLESELARWNDASAEKPFALLFLDLDRFKEINDQYGHLEGDACLREMGSRLQGALRSGDVVGRYGGDEFCLLIAGVCTDNDLQPLSRRLHQAVRQSYSLPDGEAQIGMSLGWAFSKPDAKPADLIHEADRAMYAQKRLGSSQP